MNSIADTVREGSIEINLSEPGLICPEFDSKTKVHLGEFLLFNCFPEELEKKLKMSWWNEDDAKDVNINCQFTIESVKPRFLLDKVFRQWNSIIIQQHRRNLPIPENVFDIMDGIYKLQTTKLEKEIESDPQYSKDGGKSIKSRLLKKEMKHMQTEFATLMNQSKTVIGLEEKFQTEMQLAENILKTTVKSKYDMKNLKMKGHNIEDYDKDMEEFVKIYNKIKGNIKALPDPAPEECCNVTFQSPILDLKDDDFEALTKEDKFTFMKTFALAGIPIYAPVKDASQINPWALCIRHILTTPYNLISQSTMEMSAHLGTGSLDEVNKGITLQEGDDKSRLNAVIPVFSADVVRVLKPLLRTNVFGMLNTFCILKNPNIIDMNAHFAALGCAFLRTISHNPLNKQRPSFIEDRLKLIESTAQIYLDRKGYEKYSQVLFSEPEQALMTESRKSYGDDVTIKCETLIKPAFFLYLYRNDASKKQHFKKIITLMGLEFIGRNLSKYNEETPYCDFFAPELNTNDLRKKWTVSRLNISFIYIM